MIGPPRLCGPLIVVFKRTGVRRRRCLERSLGVEGPAGPVVDLRRRGRRYRPTSWCRQPELQLGGRLSRVTVAHDRNFLKLIAAEQQVARS